MTPEFWSTFVKEATENNRILLPTPIDPVKPDLVLPHAPIASGDPAALHDVSVPLEKIAYSWDGRSKTVGDYLKDSGTDAIVFVHNGTVIAEYYENGYSPTVAHQAWSMTKSFVSTLVGIARDQGRIRSLDDPIDRYVPELRGTAWRGTAIRNILEMRSGIEWDEHTSSVADNNQITEWIDLALDYYSRGALGRTRDEYLSSLPRVTPQGTTFNYNSGNPQVLAWMLEKLYGKPFNDVLSEQLWKPSGMEAPADIMTDRTGAAIASEELFARPRDFARFGELMGNDGRAANGRQVVSAAYVREATALVPSRGAVGDDFGNGTTVGDAVSAGGYGYQWWNGATPDGFQANGFQGQYITVGPDAGLTGVRLAHTVLLNRGGDYVGGGAAEWHAVYRAVMHHLG
ncbi:serine hydrolase domain-containing protein [Williamsia sterculiae]|uniref:CubicO group peptidase, beta-lactamase class C family n=1 Tax=Williamsia sterculiae TaxID=1344003 RepID=A0A1N7GVZ6_9NOCA|nr:serine hydrolase [Williamsia sterculiae]SIS16710.1 CubicO group peptidase, beta-lactamase class C family [Williamsia sterculiae]